MPHLLLSPLQLLFGLVTQHPLFPVEIKNALHDIDQITVANETMLTAIPLTVRKSKLFIYS